MAAVGREEIYFSFAEILTPRGWMRFEVLLLYNFPYSTIWKFCVIDQMEETFLLVTSNAFEGSGLQNVSTLILRSCTTRVHCFPQSNHFWTVNSSFFQYLFILKNNKKLDQSLLSHRTEQLTEKTETTITAVMND